MNYIVCIVVMFGVWLPMHSFASTPITVLTPLQSANSVVNNDCNLIMIDSGAVYERYGTDSSAGFWSAQDILTAYNAAISNTQCGGIATVGNPYSAYLIDNLCTIALAKLGATAEKDLGLQSYPRALEFWTQLYKDGTNPQGVRPEIIFNDYNNLMGTLVPIMYADASIGSCGQIILRPQDGLRAMYQQLTDSIYKIYTDCSSNGNFNPFESVKYRVLGPKFGYTNSDAALQRCQSRLTQSQLYLTNAVKNISIIGLHRYANSTLQAQNTAIQQINDIITTDAALAPGLVEDSMKQTPTTSVCTV